MTRRKHSSTNQVKQTKTVNGNNNVRGYRDLKENIVVHTDWVKQTNVNVRENLNKTMTREHMLQRTTTTYPQSTKPRKQSQDSKHDTTKQQHTPKMDKPVLPLSHGYLRNFWHLESCSTSTSGFRSHPTSYFPSTCSPSLHLHLRARGYLSPRNLCAKLSRMRTASLYASVPFSRCSINTTVRNL